MEDGALEILGFCDAGHDVEGVHVGAEAVYECLACVGIADYFVIGGLFRDLGHWSDLSFSGKAKSSQTSDKLD